MLSYRQEQQYSAQSESVIKMGKPQNLTNNVTICKIKKKLSKLILTVDIFFSRCDIFHNEISPQCQRTAQ